MFTRSTLTGSRRVVRTIVPLLVVVCVPLASATPALAKGLGWS